MNKEIPADVRAELRLHFLQRKTAREIRGTDPATISDRLMKIPGIVALDNYLNRYYV